MLGLAISIAASAHEGQYDKAGKPYILHPLHVMNGLLYDEELAIIGVLHDVIEDTSVTIDHLLMQGFSTRVLTALNLLTHKEGQEYSQYIENIAVNYDAIRVKRKDLEHNSDITRLKGVTPKDLARMEKYHAAFICLGLARNKFRNI